LPALRILPLLLVCALTAGCGGGGGDGGDGDRAATDQTVKVWIAETEPERVEAARANFARFTQASGVKVRLEAVGDDDIPDRVTAAARDGTLPDVMQLPMASAHVYARQRIVSADAAQDVVR
jgi:multiple sugar transport system substrate-binding protein